MQFIKDYPDGVLLNPINLRPMSNDEFAIFKAVASKYLYISANGRSRRVLANTCVDLDRDIKLISEDLVRFRAQNNMQTHINFLMYANELVLSKFNQFDCRNRIEETRLDTAGTETTKFAITQEKSVLGKSSKENTVYIIIGSLVVLSSLLILLKSKK
jgi:hypothetical protein